MLKNEAQVEMFERLDGEHHEMMRQLRRKIYEYSQMRGPEAHLVCSLLEVARDTIGRIGSMDRIAIVKANLPSDDAEDKA